MLTRNSKLNVLLVQLNVRFKKIGLKNDDMKINKQTQDLSDLMQSFFKKKL